MLRLISSGALTFGGTEIEIADQRSVARSPSGSSASNIMGGGGGGGGGGLGSAQPSLRHNQGGGPPERLPLPSKGGKLAPRVLKVKKKKTTGRVSALDTQVRDFIP